MKTDLYTKTVLTIIAVALTANVLKTLVTPVMADTKRYTMVPVNADGSINVTLKKGSSPMDVNIENIDMDAFYKVQPLHVKINN